MAQDGSLGVLEAISSPIHPMESSGLSPLPGMRCLQLDALRSHRTGHYGSLEVLEQIASPIRLMESHGLRLLLGMGFSQPTVKQSRGTGHYGSLEAHHKEK